MTSDHRTPAEIEADIQSERARLSSDLETLQDRLTVDGLMEEVRLQVRTQIDSVTAQLKGQIGTVTSEVATNLRDQVSSGSKTVSRIASQNPWPLAVIGAGLAWLAISNAAPDRGRKTRRVDTTRELDGPRHVGMAPIKRTTDVRDATYDTRPADAAAHRLEAEADDWADAALGTGSNPIPPYDPEPSWARDDNKLTTTRR